MQTIGSEVFNVPTKKVDFMRPIDKITILTDSDFGVCDVIVYDEDN